MSSLPVKHEPLTIEIYTFITIIWSSDVVHGYESNVTVHVHVLEYVKNKAGSSDGGTGRQIGALNTLQPFKMTRARRHYAFT